MSRLKLGAPLVPPAVRLAPVPAAFCSASTVSDWGNPEALSADVTVTAVDAAGTSALQISDVPRSAFARASRVQVRPAPDMTTDCGELGPSAPTSASSSSLGADVVNAAVWTAPIRAGR